MAVLKFELTSLFPKHIKEARLCCAFAIIITIVFSCIFGVIFVILKWLNLFSPIYQLYSYPLIIFLITFEQIALNWLVRLQKFKLMSVCVIFKACVIAMVQFLLHKSLTGLWIGFMIGFLLVSLLYLMILISPLKNIIFSLSIRKFIVYVKKYKKFPLFTLPAATMNTLGSQLPIIIIGTLFGDKWAGYFLMVNKIVTAPTVLISTNINKVLSQIVTQKIAHNNTYDHTITYFLKLTCSLAMLVGLLVFCFVEFDGMIILLGDEWRPAEILCLILLPAAMFGFVAKSVSKFAIYGKNEWGLYFQLFYAVFSFASLYGVHFVTSDFHTVLSVYSGVICAIYLAQIMLVKNIAKQQKMMVGS